MPFAICPCKSSRDEAVRDDLQRRQDKVLVHLVRVVWDRNALGRMWMQVHDDMVVHDHA